MLPVSMTKSASISIPFARGLVVSSDLRLWAWRQRRSWSSSTIISTSPITTSQNTKTKLLPRRNSLITQNYESSSSVLQRYTSSTATATSTISSQLQQPHQQTYYSLFPRTLPLGPPPTGPFAIAPRTLRAEYLQLQQKLHPDLLRHSSTPSPSTQPQQPPLTSSHLSKAYTTLLDPLLRAEYILQLYTSYDPESPTTNTPSPDLLTEVLELREEIEDVAGDKDGVQRLMREIEGKIRSEEEFVGRLLEKGDWEEARMVVGRWRYWRSMMGRLGELEEELH